MKHTILFLLALMCVLTIIFMGCEKVTAPTVQTASVNNSVHAIYFAQNSLAFAWMYEEQEVPYAKMCGNGPPLLAAIIKVDGTQSVRADSLRFETTLSKPFLTTNGLLYNTIPSSEFNWGLFVIRETKLEVQTGQTWECYAAPVQCILIRVDESTVDVRFTIASSISVLAFGINKNNFEIMLSDGYHNIT